METFLLVISIYFIFGIPAVMGGLLVWIFARKHIQLRTADWLLLLLPFAIWLGATSIYGGDKSLSNLVEAFFLGCISALFFAARSVLTVVKPQQQYRWTMTALICSCLAAFALWALVPGLPE